MTGNYCTNCLWSDDCKDDHICECEYYTPTEEEYVIGLEATTEYKNEWEKYISYWTNDKWGDLFDI